MQFNFYILSPQLPLNPDLFPVFAPTFEQNGCKFVSDIRSADIILLDLHTRISDYLAMDIEYAISTQTPIITFDEFDKGGLSDLEWPYPLTNQQEQIFKHINDGFILSIHFCRLLNKNKLYPSNVFPFERSILYEEPMLSADELFNRPIDVTYIANTAPNREEIKRVFEADGRLKCNFLLGAEKLPFDKWVDENRKSKFTISASGGGYSDEKKQNLFSICAILQEITDQLLLHPFIHGETCLKFDQPPTKQDLDNIYKVVNDKEKLYGIYQRNYEFMKKYYSKEYIANNILDIIEKHND